MMNYKRGLKVLAVLVLLAGYYLFLRYTGTGIPCLFRYFFHMECPGCGISRMILAISTGEFREAFLSHPVLFCWSPFLLWNIKKNTAAYLYGKPVFLRKWEKAGTVLLLISLLLFFVWRNLPPAFSETIRMKFVDISAKI